MLRQLKHFDVVHLKAITHRFVEARDADLIRRKCTDENILTLRQRMLRLKLQLQELWRQRGKRALIDEQRPKILRLRKARLPILFHKLAVAHAIHERVFHCERRLLHCSSILNDRLRSLESRLPIRTFCSAIANCLAELQSRCVVDEVASNNLIE